MEAIITQQPLSMGEVPGEGPGPVTVRTMTPDDGEFASSMTVEAFRDKIEWALGKNNIEQFKILLADKERKETPQYFQRNLIALYNGERAGLCALKSFQDKESEGDFSSAGCRLCLGLICMELTMNEAPPARTTYVDHICVDDKFRGKGIGKVLLERADFEAKKLGSNIIYLLVTRTNRARNLYERHGYSVTDNVNGCCCTWCAVGVAKFYKMEKPLV